MKKLIEVRNAKLEDAPEIQKFVNSVYSEFDGYPLETIKSQINNFQEGCFVILLGEKIVAYSASLLIDEKKAMAPHTWDNRRFNFLKQLASKVKLKQVVFENSKVLKKFMGNTLDHVFTRGLNLIKARADRLKDESDHSAMLLRLKIFQ